jgi:hypothetical protein
MNYWAEMERHLAWLRGATPEEAARIQEIGLVVYDEESWATLCPDRPAKEREAHEGATLHLARQARALGFTVATATIGLDRYRDWLDGRDDSQALRTEFAAATGTRLGLWVTGNAVGWCLTPTTAVTPTGSVESPRSAGEMLERIDRQRLARGT